MLHATTARPAAPETLILDIAARHFFIETLDTRNRDQLDFNDVAVWAKRAALHAAYTSQQDGGNLSRCRWSLVDTPAKRSRGGRIFYRVN